MAETTGIAWTQSTWNPWTGCAKVSAGCDLCYMFRDKARYGQDPETVVRSKTTFNNPLKKAWQEPRLIFVCSWSDWFHADADPWRDEAWDIIRRTPQHTYQILTKRHGRVKKNLPPDWPLPNVWLGFSAEDDENFWRRAEVFKNIRAEVKFVSAEPLLGPIMVTPEQLVDYGIDWMIVGGESGPGARPMDIQWVRDIHHACDKSGTPFFLKQLGGHPDKRADSKASLDGEFYTQMPHAFNGV